MSAEPPRPRPPRGSRAPRTRSAPGPAPAGDDIQDAYLRRSIAEIGALQDEIASCELCHAEGALPVMASGSPQAEIVLLKWSASPSEQQEGVAFFGRAGTAILKSMERLGIDPLTLYGTLCVKCAHDSPDRPAELGPPWLARELAIVLPKIVVPMGSRTLEALNRLDFPLSEPLVEEVGAIQRWTPTIDALYVPDIDQSLDEQRAKREFWQAFRALGDWHQQQPPY
jgi:uracil-DNA glycosylase family 4